MARRTLLFIVLFAATTVSAFAAGHGGDRKLDAALLARAHGGRALSRVIVRTGDGSSPDALIRSVHGTPGRRLIAIQAQVAEIPDESLDTLAERAEITSLTLDRPVLGTMDQPGTAT